MKVEHMFVPPVVKPCRRDAELGGDSHVAGRRRGVDH